MEKTFRKFIPLAKVDETTHSAYGEVTGEKPDADGEICDYKFAKQSYRTWSEESAANTKAAGQDVSLGNIRLQHTLQIAGKAVQLDFNDDKKVISLGTEPATDDIWKLLKGGFITGYSHGGVYAFRKCNVCETDMPEGRFCPSCKKAVYVRYGPILAEVSYVDRPCYKDAHFTFVQANGSIELKKFEQGDSPMDPTPTSTEVADRLKNIETMIAKGLQKESKTKRVAGEELSSDCFAYVGDKENTATWKLAIGGFSSEDKTKRHIRRSLLCAAGAKGIPDEDKPKVKAKIVAAAKKHSVEVSEDADKVLKAWVDAEVDALIVKTAESKGMKKGMYDVQRLASILQDLAYIRIGAEYEREREQDDSELPEDLQQQLEALAECFLMMAEEETKELTEAADEAGKAGYFAMTTTNLDLQKAARKSIAEHTKAMKASISSHCEKMCKAHTDHRDAMHAHVDKLHKILGVEEADADGKSKTGTDEPESTGLSAATATPLAHAAKTVSYELIGKTSDGVEVFKKVEKAEAAPVVVVSTVAASLTAEEAFNLGMQAVLKAMGGESDCNTADENGKKVAKANATAGAPAPGVGDRNTTLLNGGPVLRVMPVTKAQDDPATTVADPATPAKVDVTKVMSGDLSEVRKFMASAKPAEIPPTIASAMSGRHHSAV